MQLSPGDLIDHKYKVIQQLGAGGMGTVYRVWHRELERLEAMKLLVQEATDENGRARFEREALSMSLLQHRNIVVFFGYGFHRSFPYICMENLDGMSLYDLLKEEPTLNWVKACKIAIQVLSGLSYAHSSGVIHRDLKPSNIMITDSLNEPVVKLIDFGLAKVLPSSGKDVQQITAGCTAIGTLFYMSPEQCLGQPAEARSDIYSLGCILYEALSGAPPYTSDYPLLIQRLHITGGEKKSLLECRNDVPEELAAAVDKAIATDPADRYQTANEMMADLAALLESAKGAANTNCDKGSSNKLKRNKQQNRRKLFQAAGLVSIAAAVAFGACKLGSKQSSSIELMRQAIAVHDMAKQDDHKLRAGILAEQALERDKTDNLLESRQKIDARVFVSDKLWEEGKFAQALDGYEQAIALAKRSQIQVNYWLAISFEQMANDHREHHQTSRLLALIKSVLAGSDTTSQGDRIRCASAQAACVMGKPEEALLIMQQADGPKESARDNDLLNDRCGYSGVYTFAYCLLNQPAKAVFYGREYAKTYDSQRVREPNYLVQLMCAEIALGHWDAARQELAQYSKVMNSSSVPPELNLLFRAHAGDWMGAQKAAHRILSTLNKQPQDVYWTISEFDFRLYASLAREARRFDIEKEMLGAADELSIKGKRYQW